MNKKCGCGGKIELIEEIKQDTDSIISFPKWKCAVCRKEVIGKVVPV